MNHLDSVASKRTKPTRLDAARKVEAALPALGKILESHRKRVADGTGSVSDEPLIIGPAEPTV